jgi:two-component system response regulator YesN
VKKMRMLIVDDEDLEQEGLKSLIPSFGLDIEICGSAFDGREALALAQQLHPDIVVTDVRMPAMDGIALARQLRLQGYDCFILFISGFEDFQAARDALSLGASAWLVKPVNREELRGVLCGICDTANKLTVKKLEEERRGRRLEELLPLERQEFLKSLLLHKEPQDGGAVIVRAAALGMQLPPGRFAVMAAEMQDAPLRLERRMDERFAGLGRAMRFPDALEPVLLPGSRLALILTFAEIAGEETVLNRLESTAEQILVQAAAWCEACVGVGVSLIGCDPGDLGVLYGQACTALDEKLRYGLGRVIFFSENPQQANADRHEQIVRQVQKIVQNEIGGDLSAEAVAARIYLTASHLRRVFKNRTGVTLQDYVLRMRMERARELLREPANRVRSVAAKVGYESTSYFCLVFKRFFGVTPGDFRTGLDFPD